MIRASSHALVHLRHNRGFGLWDSLLLVLLIAALLAIAFLTQQSRLEQRLAEQQAATVRWADQRVSGFVTSHLRLPCPDLDDDGVEDCAAGATSGWLPLATLGLAADAAVRGPIRIRYNLLRPSGGDPAIISTHFEPVTWDGTRYAYGATNGLDLCQKLVDIVATDASATLWSLAIRRQDGTPDLTRSHAAAAVSEHLGCATAMSSVNGIALAVDVVNEVLSQQAATKESAIITIAFNALHIALAAIDVTLAAIGLASSITALGTASSLLATAIGTCVVLVGCAFIPVYTAAVVAAGVAIGLFAGAIAAGAAGIAALVVSTALAIEVAIKTGNSQGDQTLDIDLATMEQAAIDAENRAAQSENEAASAYQDMQSARSSRDARRQQVLSVANSMDPDGDYGAEVNAALAAAVAYANAISAHEAAQGSYDRAEKEVLDLIVAVHDQNVACTNADLPDEQYKCDTIPHIENRLAQAQLEADAALAARSAAQQQRNTALADYNDAKAAITDVFGSMFLSQGWFFVAYLDEYREAYLKWMNAVTGYNVKHQEALDARAGAIQARQQYEDFKAAYENPSAPVTGSGITVWAGAEAILRQADANGVLE